MGNNRKELTPAKATEWAQMAHALYIDALMSQSDWTVGEVAFHGGTSLRLSWNSSRYSEDLDFLLSREVKNLDRIARKVEATIGEMSRRIDPEFVIEMKDKTKDQDRMGVYVLTVSHPGYVGKAKIKAEFWRTDPNYLEKYPTQMRTPRLSLSADELMSLISNPVPAATLETAYADKLVAFATRPFLKWRDLYDLWWIGTQTSTELDINSLCEQFEHNISAYTPLDGLPPHQALALFLNKSKAEIFSKADPDIKNWLPNSLWERMRGEGIHQIIDYVFHAIENISSHIENSDRDQANLKLIPRAR